MKSQIEKNGLFGPFPDCYNIFNNKTNFWCFKISVLHYKYFWDMKYEQISPTLNLLVFLLLFIYFFFLRWGSHWLGGWVVDVFSVLAGYPGSTPEIKLLRGLIVSLLLVVSNRLYLKQYDTLSTADLRSKVRGNFS